MCVFFCLRSLCITPFFLFKEVLVWVWLFPGPTIRVTWRAKEVQDSPLQGTGFTLFSLYFSTVVMNNHHFLLQLKVRESPGQRESKLWQPFMVPSSAGKGSVCASLIPQALTEHTWPFLKQCKVLFLFLNWTQQGLDNVCQVYRGQKPNWSQLCPLLLLTCVTNGH